MATKKTTPDPRAFLEGVTPAGRRRDALTLVDLMREATGLEPRMCSSSIVGFGEYAYEYESGRKGTAPAASLSPRKAATVVYLLDGIGNHEAALAKLGPHTTGVGCVYIKDLGKIDLRVLAGIVRKSFKTLTAGTYGKRARDSTTSPSASKKAPSKKPTAKRALPARAAPPKKPRVFAMSFASVYPLYVQKAEKKGRTRQEVDQIIAWLTGYRGKTLARAIDLRDLATREATVPAFSRRFEAVRKRQLRRRGFFDRWKRANANDSGER